MGDVKFPPTNFSGEEYLSRGNRPLDFMDLTKNYCPSAWLWKNHCPCIFEGHISTNPILSALHLQGPKSKIYVHFHWVSEHILARPCIEVNRRSNLTKSFQFCIFISPWPGPSPVPFENLCFALLGCWLYLHCSIQWKSICFWFHIILPSRRVITQRIQVTLGITCWSSPRVHIDGKVWHLDVGSLPLGAVIRSKGWVVRPSKRYVSWVQN